MFSATYIYIMQKVSYDTILLPCMWNYFTCIVVLGAGPVLFIFINFRDKFPNKEHPRVFESMSWSAEESREYEYVNVSIKLLALMVMACVEMNTALFNVRSIN